MSAKKSRKSKVKKVVDKWKEKEWYDVVSPPYIGDKFLGETIADDPEKLKGRIIEMSKMGLRNDLFYDINLKLGFRIINVDGNIAKTEFIGHEVAKEQIRSQIRRNRSRIEIIQNVTTKDKGKLRVYTIIITPIRTGTSRQKAIRHDLISLLVQTATEHNFDSYVLKMVNGELVEKVKETINKLVPTVMVDIRKSKVLSLPPKTVEAAS